MSRSATWPAWPVGRYDFAVCSVNHNMHAHCVALHESAGPSPRDLPPPPRTSPLLISISRFVCIRNQPPLPRDRSRTQRAGAQNHVNAAFDTVRQSDIVLALEYTMSLLLSMHGAGFSNIQNIKEHIEAARRLWLKH